MQIQLISHASVLITCGDIKILTDPWYVNDVFNNSWRLLGTAKLSEKDLKSIQYIWISHEHPDHFNVPTLKSFPDYFKSEVTILFQQNNSHKIFDAMKNWGFQHFQSLGDQQLVSLNSKTTIYCHQAQLGDSCLGVRHEKASLLNINDAELTERDCSLILKKFGNVDLILNQFSLAGYSGFRDYAKYLPEFAKEKRVRLENNQKCLNAKLTIPFASFMYFSTVDNQYMNAFHNSPQSIAEYMDQRGLATKFLKLGKTLDTEEIDATEDGMAFWQEQFVRIDELEYTAPERVPVEKIREAASQFCETIAGKYPRCLLWMVRPLKIYIPDLKALVLFSLTDKTLELMDSGEAFQDEADLIIYSQPLYFGFKFSFGFETLAVSARILVNRKYRSWKILKIISILFNKEIFLHGRYIFNKQTRLYLQERLWHGLFQQLFHKAVRNFKIRRHLVD